MTINTRDDLNSIVGALHHMCDLPHIMREIGCIKSMTTGIPPCDWGKDDRIFTAFVKWILKVDNDEAMVSVVKHNVSILHTIWPFIVTLNAGPKAHGLRLWPVDENDTLATCAHTGHADLTFAKAFRGSCKHCRDPTDFV